MRTAALLFFFCLSFSLRLAALPDIPDLDPGSGNVTNTPPQIGNGDTGKKSPLLLTGLVETTAQFALPPLGVYAEGWGVVKLEGRLRLDLRYEEGGFSALFQADGYLYPELSPDPAPRERGMVIRQGSVGYSHEGFSVRLGWQPCYWGNADLFSSANNLYRPDYRDLSNTDRTQSRIGVFGLTSRLVLGETALELALLPVAEFPALAREGSFWHRAPDPLGGIAVREMPAVAAPGDFSAAALGLRWGGNVAGVDFHLGWQYGPQRELLFRSVLTGTNGVAGALVERHALQRHIHLFSANAAFTLGSLAIRLEAAFSPDMTALRRISDSQAANEATNLAPGNPVIVLNDPEQQPWLAWTIGADFPLWRGSRLLLEWKQDFYLKNNSAYEPSRISDIVALLVSQNLAGEKLKLQAGAVFTKKNGEYLGACGWMLTWNITQNVWLSQGTFFLAGTAFFQGGCRF